MTTTNKPITPRTLMFKYLPPRNFESLGLLGVRLFSSNSKGSTSNPLSVTSLYYCVQNRQNVIYCKNNLLISSNFKIFIRVLSEVFKLQKATSPTLFYLYCFYHLLPSILTSSYYDYLVKSLTVHTLPEFLLAMLLKIAPKVKSPNSGSAFTLGFVTSPISILNFIHSLRSLIESDQLHHELVEIAHFGQLQAYWTRSVKADLLVLCEKSIALLSHATPDIENIFLKNIVDNLASVFYGNSCPLVSHQFVYSQSGLTPIGIFRFRHFKSSNVDPSAVTQTYVLPQSSVKGFDTNLFEMFCVFLFLLRPIYLGEDAQPLPDTILAGEGVVDLGSVAYESAFELLFNLRVKQRPTAKLGDIAYQSSSSDVAQSAAIVTDTQPLGSAKSKVSKSASRFKTPTRSYSTNSTSLQRIVDYMIVVDYDSFIYKRIGFSLHQPTSIQTVYQPGDN